jgi:hypothetical protein
MATRAKSVYVNSLYLWQDGMTIGHPIRQASQWATANPSRRLAELSNGRESEAPAKVDSARRTGLGRSGKPGWLARRSPLMREARPPVHIILEYTLNPVAP